jgi:TATA-box binding protein (TBP) (component of TFIID and TFIIIB)
MIPQLTEKAETFMKDIHEETKRINTQYDVDIKLTTMTVMVLVNCDYEIDLKTIGDRFSDEDIQKFIFDVHGYPNAVVMKQRGKNFNNSVVFSIPSQESKHVHQAVKVFCNGNLHITGYKTLNDVFNIAEIFITMLELMLHGNGISEWFKIEDYNIQLINFCFQLKIPPNVVLHLQKLHEICVKKCEYFCSYNSDHYSGIIMKANDFSVLIFESGSIIITSITNSIELKNAFAFTYAFFNKHKEDVYTDDIGGKQDAKVKKRAKKGDTERDFGRYAILK